MTDKIRAEVYGLLNDINEDCAFISSSSQIAEHPANQKIINMGMPAVPYIIKAYLDGYTGINAADLLHKITGADPIPPEDYGYVKKIARHWAKWYEQQTGEKL